MKKPPIRWTPALQYTARNFDTHLYDRLSRKFGFQAHATKLHKMEGQQGNEVTYYKITHNNSLSSSQEGFEIENSSMAREAAFPIHEEYKFPGARSKFNSDANAFCNEALEELRASMMHFLQKLEQSALFLKRSEQVLNRLKRRHTAFAERSYNCLAEGKRQLKILNKDCHVIGEEVYEIRKELNELISNIEK